MGCRGAGATGKGRAVNPGPRAHDVLAAGTHGIPLGGWLPLARIGCSFGAVVLSSLLYDVPAASQPYQQPTYQIERVFGDLTFDVRYDDDSREVTGRPDVEETERTFGEEITVGADGWAYHPTFLRFFGEVGLRFEQDSLQTDSQASTEVDRQRLNFDVNLRFLPEKPYPFSIFATKVTTDVDSPFSPRRTVDVLRYGAGLRLREASLWGREIPTRFLYRHQDTETSGAFGNDLSRDEFSVVTTHDTLHTRNRLQYEFDSLESIFETGSQQTDRHDFRLSQDWELERGSLDSNFWWTMEDGDRSSSSINLNEFLQLRLSPTVDTHYSYGINYQDFDGASQIAQSAEASITHRFYQSLYSSASFGGTYFESDLGTIYSVTTTLGENYTKRIPGGRLGLRFLPSFSYQDEDTESGILSVLGERHDITLGTLIILNSFFILPETIVVRDPITLFEFTRGIDYRIVDLGSQTAIQVNPGSDLDPAVPPLISTMSVQYDYETQASRTFTTASFVVGGTLDLWDHLTLDISYTDTTQDLISGFAEDSTLEDSTQFIARADVIFGRNRTHFEYEKLRSTITPRERYIATHTVSFRPTRRSTLGFGVGYSHDEITDTGLVSDSYSVNASATAWLAPRLLGRLNLVARQINQDTQDNLSVGSSLSFTYRYGRIELELEGTADWTRTDQKSGITRRIEETFTGVYFRVTRHF